MSPEFLAFIRAMFGADAIVVVGSVDQREIPLCGDPVCPDCVAERNQRMAAFNRQAARSTQN